MRVAPETDSNQKLFKNKVSIMSCLILFVFFFTRVVLGRYYVLTSTKYKIDLYISLLNFG